MSDEDVFDLEESLAKAQSAARSALAVLKDVEWPGDVAHTVTGPYVTCLLCGRWRKYGHEDGCALAAAIRSLEAVL